MTALLARLDPRLWGLALLTALVRVVPMYAWWWRPCVRDECTYRDLAASILRGEGMVGTRGWLWAPGYPGLLAAHGWLFGRMHALKWTQLLAAVLTTVLLYRFTRARFGTRAATIAALLFALSPTHVFYASSFWSECLYTALLFGMVQALAWARGERNDGEAVRHDTPGALRGLVVGALLGACVLFRGVATYMFPVVVLALGWGRWRAPELKRTVAALCLGMALLVGPYSAYATGKFGAFVISDRTLGQMMWLGNNDYPPITFDYGNGLIRDAEFDAVTATGRPHCGMVDAPALQDACEMKNGLAWIRAHPGEFLARVPLRVSQMLTPHSLLTRNLRSGKWGGMPSWVDEAIIVLIPFFSVTTMLAGTLGAFARGRGWYLVGASGIVAYHVAAVACLAGLSRYRVPLEPLWMVFAGAFLASPTLAMPRGRAVACALVCLVLTVLMLRFLPVAWPRWGAWW